MIGYLKICNFDNNQQWIITIQIPPDAKTDIYRPECVDKFNAIHQTNKCKILNIIDCYSGKSTTVLKFDDYSVIYFNTYSILLHNLELIVNHIFFIPDKYFNFFLNYRFAQTQFTLAFQYICENQKLSKYDNNGNESIIIDNYNFYDTKKWKNIIDKNKMLYQFKPESVIVEQDIIKKYTELSNKINKVEAFIIIHYYS
jgi:hypothetical protein